MLKYLIGYINIFVLRFHYLLPFSICNRYFITINCNPNNIAPLYLYAWRYRPTLLFDRSVHRHQIFLYTDIIHAKTLILFYPAFRKEIYKLTIAKF